MCCFLVHQTILVLMSCSIKPCFCFLFSAVLPVCFCSRPFCLCFCLFVFFLCGWAGLGLGGFFSRCHCEEFLGPPALLCEGGAWPPRLAAVAGFVSKVETRFFQKRDTQFIGCRNLQLPTEWFFSGWQALGYPQSQVMLTPY